ncbi:hypothetical protein PIB30_034548 [Stylosanthes scabra]|uniref:RanBD1 domain-containing protein n=1 Tax=Stylosanthes scabra TaxID=79078 RepID=A0ABU6SE25_9FABA|nr:hypothetical protein [Stylosanthes scabra]
MGDADNLPPSKKRVAGRELTRDTPLDDDEEDAPEVEGGTFKRASDEVLASRRIVKVRRQQSNSAPSSNPFSGIRLLTPTETTAEKKSTDENTATDDSKDTKEEKDEETKQPKGEIRGTEDKSSSGESNADKEQIVEEKNNDGKQDAKSETNDNRSESEDKKNAADKESVNKADEDKDDNDAKNIDKKENSDDSNKKAEKVESEEPSSEGGNFKSFQQLSSNQNAFTGLAGTGSNTSLFSFGCMSKEGSALSSGTSSIFGLSNNGNSGFGVSGVSPAISRSKGSGLVLQEVATETGEEDENVVFRANSALFEFADGSWKERGKGEVKVNVHCGTEKARLLMRARGNYRLILNASIYSEMKLKNMDKKGVSFACINSASEGKDGLSTFALKFKDESILEEFKCAVMAHKGDTSLV